MLTLTLKKRIKACLALFSLVIMATSANITGYNGSIGLPRVDKYYYLKGTAGFATISGALAYGAYRSAKITDKALQSLSGAIKQRRYVGAIGFPVAVVACSAGSLAFLWATLDRAKQAKIHWQETR